MNLTFLIDYEDLWWKPKAKGILERAINFYQRKVSKAEKRDLMKHDMTIIIWVN